MKPNPSRAEALFLAAIAIAEPRERSAFLDRECGDDLALRARVDALLASHDQAGNFLQPADPSTEMQAEFARLKPEEAGERIGHYKLLQQIGEGGFGVVWMAEQDEPVRRRVALKIIKLGMDTKEVIARFEQERQALAMMDHANIAKVFDAGATPFGRPYFVMELVRGIKITDYCDEAKLPTADRLGLFIAVCHAVQHAHQKGIIHRDLKPSNILVTLHDGVPVPKVIDFGVAKATQGRLTDKTLFTQFEQMIGTPLYMAPEQAEMSGLDVDTRTDIYALGVVLCELLTGRTPLDAATLAQAGYDEIRRMIREEEPKKPSTLLATMAAGLLTTTAQRRSAEPPRLLQAISGDLDWIVMRAIEKDRTRRYETANDLAQDLRRHLTSEPVAARPPSLTYKAGKFIRKHRRPVLAVAAVLLALMAGLVTSTTLYVREKSALASAETARADAERQRGKAEDARGKAEAERERAEASERRAFAAEKDATKQAAAEAAARQEAETVTTFLTSVFQSPASPRNSHSSDSEQEIPIVEHIDRAARKIDTDLKGQPETQARLRTVLARTLYALGDPSSAAPLQKLARDYYLKTLGSEHLGTLDATHNLALYYSEAGAHIKALPLREQLLALHRKLDGPEHPDTILAMNSLAFSCFHAVRIEGVQHPGERKMNFEVKSVHYDHREEALQLREQVLQLRRKILGPEHSDTLDVMKDLALSYSLAGRGEEALHLWEQVLPLSQKIHGANGTETLDVMKDLANSYADAGRRNEEIEVRKQILAYHQKAFRPEDPNTVTAMSLLANACAYAGRREDALQLREQALKFRRDHPSPDMLVAMTYLAISYRLAGRLPEAIELQEKSLEMKRRVLPLNALLLAAIDNLAECYEATGRADEAQALRKELAELKAKAPSLEAFRCPP